jgi:hypothetical protein
MQPSSGGVPTRQRGFPKCPAVLGWVAAGQNGFLQFAEEPKFDPADIGQIGTYMVAVNHQLKRPDDQQTVGLIICREKDRVTVQYALESSSLPIGVSDYVLERFIPADFKSQMPTIEEVEGELTRRMEIAKERRIEVSHTEV